MSYTLNKEEKTTLLAIQKTPYLQEAIKLVEEFVSMQTSVQEGYQSAFNEIYTILNKAKFSVDIYLQKRKAEGEINDISQALKSIAGNSFSQIIVYIFLKNKELGTIRSNIFITSQKSKVPSFDEISTIYVDGETQKPDCDLVIYSLSTDLSLNKCLILSLKTSLRERAGQTYKWKLLFEIATTENSIKEKFNISYESSKMPLMCFATVNFYEEINNPQQRGMFKFFDKAFIAKNVDADFIAKLSELPTYINHVL
ncbi:MAG: BsaWI family type II restriction enzyme [Thermoflexibacteraceae bacterium]|jgi:type II restriction enzyme